MDGLHLLGIGGGELRGAGFRHLLRGFLGGLSVLGLFGFLAGDLGLRVLHLGHGSVHDDDDLAVRGGVVAVGCRAAVALGVLDFDAVTCLQVLVAVPIDHALVGRDAAELREHADDGSIDS